MRPVWFSLSLLALLVLLPGCGSSAVTTDLPLSEICTKVVESQSMDTWSGLNEVTKGDADFNAYLSAAYGIDPADCLDGSVRYFTGVRATELALLQLAEESDADTAQQAMLEYLTNRRGSFVGYAPEEAALLDQALVLRRGTYLLLAVCPDPEAAQTAFDACFTSTGSDDAAHPPLSTPDMSGRIPFDPPGKADMTLYDTSPVVNAYQSGDTSALSEADRAILDICRQAMEDAVTPDMTPVEQERALHDWIVDWADYDETHESPHGSSPYGLLVNRTAICMGYANTFQLFMDLIGIECITVVGASSSSTSDHAWNLVRLDGDWYAVDTTWDDPIINGLSHFTNSNALDSLHHRYFNVTSDFLLETDHQWDYDLIPEATGAKP